MKSRNDPVEHRAVVEASRGRGTRSCSRFWARPWRTARKRLARGWYRTSRCTSCSRQSAWAARPRTVLPYAQCSGCVRLSIKRLGTAVLAAVSELIDMARRLPPTCLVGLGLILAGLLSSGSRPGGCILASGIRWIRRCRWRKGHFRSPEFRINADADYWFLVDTGGPLRMSWSLSEDGQVTARGVCDQEKWCDFHASPGLYRIDLDIADNNSRMNAEVPRLKVFVLGHPAELRELQACVLFLALSFSGMVTFLKLFAWRLEERRTGGGCRPLVRPCV